MINASLHKSFRIPGLCALWSALHVATQSCLAAPVPNAEKLLPPDTLCVFTVPDYQKAGQAFAQSGHGLLWKDQAMKPFVDNFTAKWREEFVLPLQRELGINFDNYSGLAKGQVTLAITQNGWPQDKQQRPGVVLLVDAKEKSGALRTNLSELRAKWLESGKKLRTERIRDFEFSIVPLSTNDVPKTLSGLLPKPLEYQELGAEEKPESKGLELAIGQADSLLIVATSIKVAEQVVSRLSGSLPSLGEQGAYSGTYSAMFREAPMHGWLNARALLDAFAKISAEKEENPEAPNPMGSSLKPEKLLESLGLLSLRSIGFHVREADRGTQFEMFLHVPETSREGLFKILAGVSKDTSVLPFVPANVVEFHRWRIDGQQMWATVEKMLGPQAMNGINFLIDTANMTVKDKDPSFDLRRNLIGNLGDDIVSYTQPPRADAPDPLAGPSLMLVGSPRAEELAAALKSILLFVTAQSGPPSEREFLGRKIYSAPMPAMPVSMAEGASEPAAPQTLHYSSSGGYVAFSADAATLEEYLRSSGTDSRTLRENSALAQAREKVAGPGVSYFGYENQAMAMRQLFEALRQGAAGGTNVPGLNVLDSIPGMRSPEKDVQSWMDFSLLPPFAKVAKYFNFTVTSLGARSDGLTYRVYAPPPPAVVQGEAAK